jgi:predicted phage terminase large subunit-like protein
MDQATLAVIERMKDVAAELQRRDCRRLSEFIRQAWPIIEPGTDLLWNWHIDILSDYLEAVTAGDITRLVINMPPRYMKSICASVLWPCWEWGPVGKMSSRWVFWSYAAMLSTKHSVDRRLVLESDWYQDRWPVRLTSDQNVKTEYVNQARGHMIATSFGGSAHGKGGTRLVIDDPHNPKQALSDLERDKVIQEFRQSVTTRLDNRTKGAIVVIMQRLHTDDLSAYCLDQGYVHLKLDNPARKTTVIMLPSGHRVERAEGNILWPDRESAAQVAQTKRDLGSYAFSGQYEQEPVPLGGGMIQRAWLNYWEALPPGLTGWLQSWDMSFKDSEGTSYVVGQVWARHKSACYYLVDQVRDRAGFTAACDMVKQLAAKWPQAGRKLVESKANGPAIVNALKKTVPGLIEVEPEGSKLARLSAVSPLFEAGNVFIPAPERAAWVQDYVVEVTTFPKAANDDQVDATSQALNDLALKSIQPGMPHLVGTGKPSYWKRNMGA